MGDGLDWLTGFKAYIVDVYREENHTERIGVPGGEDYKFDF
jgi:hypothetical protein